MQCKTEFDKREKMSWWGRLAEKQVQWIKLIPHWIENNAANFYRVSPSNTEPNSKPHHQHHQDIGFFSPNFLEFAAQFWDVDGKRQSCYGQINTALLSTKAIWEFKPKLCHL